MYVWLYWVFVVWAFSSCGERELLLIAVLGPLLLVASCRAAQAAGLHGRGVRGPRCSAPVESCWIRARTCVSCIDGQILYH